MTPDRLLVGVDEAARMLSLSKRSVQQLIYLGELPSVLIGRCRRIRIDDLVAFVERLRGDSDIGRLEAVR